MLLHKMRSWVGSRKTTGEVGQRRRPRYARLCLERLEDRLTPTPTVTIIAVESAPIQASAQGYFIVSRNAAPSAETVALHVDSSSTVPAGYNLTGNTVSFNSSTNIVTVSFPAQQFLERITFTPANSGVADRADTLQLDVNTPLVLHGFPPPYLVGTPSTAAMAVAANGLIVTNTNATGDGSLAQAVANADSSPTGGTITFAAAAGQTFATEQPIQLNVFNPNLDLTKSNITIQGPSSGVTIEGASASSLAVITVASGIAATLANLNIMYGAGGIFNEGTLNVQTCTISNNQGQFGGIFNEGTLSVHNSTISHNTVNGGTGGGIANPAFGTVTVENTTIYDNYAPLGGGIYSAGPLTVQNVTISDNHAGAGIYDLGSTATVSNTTITANTIIPDTNVPGFLGDGAGLLVSDGLVTLFSTTISYNTATRDGGGIYDQPAPGVTVAITATNVTIAGNTAGRDGGGIDNAFGGAHDGPSLTLTDCTITANNAGPGDVGGGGIANTGTLTLNNTIVAGNFASENPNLYNSNSTFLGAFTSDIIPLVEAPTPYLAPLGDYGGPTATVALVPSTSDPAIANGVDIAILATRLVPGATTITVDDPGLSSAGIVIQIDAEYMLVIAVSKNTLTVQRHYDQLVTNSMTYPVGTAVFIGTDQRGYKRPDDFSQDIGAFQTQGFDGNPDLVVTSNADPVAPPGRTTLREAVNVADVDTIAGVSETVTFAIPGPLLANFGNNNTITLTQGLVMLSPSSGTELTIAGGGAITVSGNGEAAYTLLYVAPGAQASINGLTLTGADGPAAIFNAFGTESLSDDNFVGNSGGAIANFGTLTIDVCTFSDNSGPFGGAIANYATLTIDDSTFADNSAGMNNGGAIDNVIDNLVATPPSTTLTVSNSTFAGNSANEGGAIYNGAGATATISIVTFANSISNVVFGDNSASDGGGIWNAGVMTVDQSTISNCTAVGTAPDGEGGGICNGFDGALTLVNSTIAQNSAADGAGIYNEYELTATDCTISGNSASVDGGGIYNFVISDISVSSPLLLDNTIVAANTSTVTPGDVDDAVIDAIVKAEFSMIGNAANSGITAGHGNILNPQNLDLGSLGNFGGPTQTIPLLTGSPVGGNNPITFASGSGQPFASPQTITLAAGLNLDNPLAGASITIEGPPAGVTIAGGGSTSNFSVFTVAANTIATLEDLTISIGNTKNNGGGIENNGTLTVSGVTLAHNVAVNGGAIDNNGVLAISNSTIADNSATAGGGIDNEVTGTTTASNVTVADATAGGDIFNAGTLTLSNSIVAGNGASILANIDGSFGGNTDNMIATGATSLAALANNGGPTATIALNAGSPALGKGGAVTQIAAGDNVGPGDATITVLNAAAVANAAGVFFIQIGGEIMLVTQVAGNTLTVERGFFSTTATSHQPGAGVFLATDQRGVLRSTTPPNIGAFEASTAPLTAFLAATPSALVFGQALQLTAAVTGPAGAPGGYVQFDADGTTILGTATLSADVATLTTTALPVGMDTVTALYVAGSGGSGTTPPNAVTVNVSQATPQVSLDPVSLTYGTALANSQLSGTATWIVGGNPVTVQGTFTYTSAAGTVLGATNGQSEAVTFTPSDATDYTTVSTTVSVNVGQATPTVSLNPVSLIYGAALANSQLSGTATWIVGGNTVTVQGTFIYTSAAGTVLGAGNGQSEAVTFTPSDTTDYATASTTVSVNVGRATPTVSLNPVSLTYGTALANSQLTGTASWIVGGNTVTVIGTFTYTSAAGTVLGAGNGQSEAVAFTPSDATDYATASTTVTVNVVQSSTTVSGVVTPPDPQLNVPFTFTTTVSAVAPGSGTPTGEVAFQVDSNPASDVALVVGSASLVLPNGLAPGAHVLTATYLGNSNFADSAPFTVNLSASTISGKLTALPNQAYTFTASVSSVAPGGATPTGFVQFQVGGDAPSEVVLAAGQASLAFPNGLPSGATVITATYLGDSNFAPSSTFTQTLPYYADLAVSASASSASVLVSQNLTYTISVVNNGPEPATGVTLTDTLPAGVTLVSATYGQGNAAIGTGSVTLAVPTLAYGASATLTLVVTVTAGAGSTITDAASVTATTPDSNPASTSASVLTTVIVPFVVTDATDLAAQQPGSDNPLDVGGGVSLRSAIAAANVDAGNGISDTIIFAPGLAGHTITLAEGVLELSGAPETPETGVATITIDASSLAGGITISGDLRSGVFQVDSGVTAVLDGLEIVEGDSSSNGGGIDNAGNLTVADCTILSNVAADMGGGIYNSVTGTLTVQGGTIAGNAAAPVGAITEASVGFGGGIFNSGTTTIIGSTISNNQGQDGGGLYNSGA